MNEFEFSNEVSSEADESTDTSFVPTVVRWIAAAVLLLIPIKIVRSGYRPVLDDTIADAAKAVSGRDWTDVLVLKDQFRMDPHVGWHAVLRTFALAAHWGTSEVVVFAVVALFALFALAPLPWLKRPESWLATLAVVAAMGTGITERLMLGRPFIISACVLTTILWLWNARREEPPTRKHLVLLTALFAGAAALHGSWYLWVLLVASFALAGEYQWARAVALCWMVGTLGGALLTGHPLDYLLESVQMGVEAFGKHVYQSTLVHEFRPVSDNAAGLLLIVGLLAFRRITGSKAPSLARSPAFWLACLGFVLGYKATRFWADWGLIALLVGITAEAEGFLAERFDVYSLKRIALAIGLAGTLYLIATNDADSRWTLNRETRYLAEDNPELAGWLPQSGGILYSSEMALFYQTFYRNPYASWRYITGFEPAMMPDDDFLTFENIGLSHGNPVAYLPWIRKMRPQDRVAMHWGEQPRIPQLEWKNVQGVWLGRIKQ